VKRAAEAAPSRHSSAVGGQLLTASRNCFFHQPYGNFQPHHENLSQHRDRHLLIKANSDALRYTRPSEKCDRQRTRCANAVGIAWAFTQLLGDVDRDPARLYANQPATVAPLVLRHRSATALKARSACRPVTQGDAHMIDVLRMSKAIFDREACSRPHD
jgi:hypothetical protein